MTAAFVFAVLLTCAGDPVPATVDMPLPPQSAVPVEQVVEQVEEKKLDTLEPDLRRARPRNDAKTRFLLELLATALEVAINR